MTHHAQESQSREDQVPDLPLDNHSASGWTMDTLPRLQWRACPHSTVQIDALQSPRQSIETVAHEKQPRRILSQITLLIWSPLSHQHSLLQEVFPDFHRLYGASFHPLRSANRF